MIRALVGLVYAIFLIPLFVCRAVVRCAVRSRVTLALAIALILVFALNGCAVVPAVLEHDARQCRATAWTVADMLKCQEIYPAHKTSPSDWASQPIGELGRIIQHKGHDHE